jgi:phospholipid transport system substrate-binding protein
MTGSAALLATLLGSVPVTSAAPAPPRPWLQKMVDQASELAKRKVEPDTAGEEKWHADAKSIIDGLLDWDEMTKASLGTAWDQRSAAEKKEFSSLLREMIETSYRTKLRLAARGNLKKPQKIEINWIEEKVENDKAKVVAKVKSDKTMAMLEFSLLWSHDRWRVYDLAIDDVSTVRTYRSQFRKLIAEQGFPALLERMRTKITDIREGRADLGP